MIKNTVFLIATAALLLTMAVGYSTVPGSKACVDEPGGLPVITSLSSSSGAVGSRLEIRGCNFAGFEGDKNAWIENADGFKGILYGEAGSTDKLLIVKLKLLLCQDDVSYSGLFCSKKLALTKGSYKIYTMPWAKKSNEMSFIMK